MTTLVEALQRKFEALTAGDHLPECTVKLPPHLDGSHPIYVREIAMDHQEITSIGDPKEMIHIFESVRELDVSTNQVRFWSDVFALLECSPHLQLLNLSYNPLQDSYLFCEAEDVDYLMTGNTDSANDSPSFTSKSVASSQNTTSNCNDVSLLANISFSEENMSCTQLFKVPHLPPSCLSTQLNTLLLNSTRVPWKRVLALLNYLPNLANLHAALNDYAHCCSQEAVPRTFPRFPQIKHLYFSENRFDQWSDVCCLGEHFPCLQHLVLLRNPLQWVPARKWETHETPFAMLEDLNLMETRINAWESVDALNQWFPVLKSLRLGKDIPLLENSDTQIFRYEVIARIPTLTSYNVTPISEDERERAERDFVRRFGQVEPSQRPQRFWELEQLHGYVAPLASVDLSPKKTVRLRIQFEDQEKWHSCALRQSVGRLRGEVCALFGLSGREARTTRLVFFDAGIVAAQGPEEMRHLGRLLYTYHPNDGDTLLITRRS